MEYREKYDEFTALNMRRLTEDSKSGKLNELFTLVNAMVIEKARIGWSTARINVPQYTLETCTSVLNELVRKGFKVSLTRRESDVLFDISW